MPNWVPEGWEVDDYTAVLLKNGHEFTVSYSNPKEKNLMQYSYRISSDLSDLQIEYEQNDAGIYEIIGNNREVYFTHNYDQISAIWLDENIIFDFSGPITKKNIVKMILSIQ